MRRVGDAEWRYFDCHKDAAKAFSVSRSDVSKLINDPSKARLRETFEARPACAPAAGKKRKRPAKKKQRHYVQRCVEWAYQKSTGKWAHTTFPGREFDDLDELRAAKKVHYARRAKWSAQCTQWRGL